MKEQLLNSRDALKESVKARNVIFFAGLMVLVAVVVVVYQPALSSGAIFFDDNEYLLENHLVLNPGLSSVKQFFVEVLAPSTVRGYYQPLAMISLMLDYALGGRVDNLMGFHRTSLCLHVANMLLVVVLFYLLFGRYLPALIIGLLFGLHPLNADSVVWIAERKTVLAGFFTLGCLVLYLLFVRKNRRSIFVLSMISYVLALLSKPTCIMLPFLLLLLDFWPLRRLSKRVIVEKVPFFIIFVFAGIITLLSQSRAGKAGLPFDTPFIQIPIVLSHNIFFYLEKFLYPAGLSAYYPFPNPFNLSHPSVFQGLVGTGVILPVVFLSLRKNRAVLTGWLFFFIAILPTMGLVSVTDVIAANRYMYLPMLGFLLPFGAFLQWLLSERPVRLRLKLLCVLTAAVVIAAACAEYLITYRYLQNWKDSKTLYKYLLRRAVDAPILHNNLGNVFYKEANFQEAISSYQKAISLDAEYVMAYNNLGNVYSSLGRIDKAVEYYQKALSAETDPTVEYYKLYYNLALTFVEDGRLEQAYECFGKAAELKQDFVSVYDRWARTLVSDGKLEQALEKFQTILELSPGDVQTLCNIGILLERQGKTDEAIKHYRRALQIDPDNSKARELLGAVSAKKRPH